MDPAGRGAPLYPIHTGSFNIFAWQFLFVAGVAIGHARLTKPGNQMPFRPLLSLGALAVCIYGIGVTHLGWRLGPDWLFGIFVNKPNLGALRLANFGMVAYLVANMGAVSPGSSPGDLRFLGQHSLSVVAAQSVAVMIILQFSGLFATPLANWLSTAGCIGILFAAAWTHETVGRWLEDLRSVRARQAAGLAVSRPHDVRPA